MTYKSTAPTGYGGSRFVSFLPTGGNVQATISYELFTGHYFCHPLFSGPQASGLSDDDRALACLGCYRDVLPRRIAFAPPSSPPGDDFTNLFRSVEPQR